MGIETVSADLARLLTEWIGDDPDLRAEALGAYREIRPLSDEESRTIEAFERSTALLGGGHWIPWLLIERRTFRDPSAAVSRMRRAVERLTTTRLPGIKILR